MDNKALITEQELLLVVQATLDAAIEGNVKAAALIFNHFIPKPKPRAIKTAYKNIDDIRNAFNLGMLTSEEVISELTAINLLADNTTTVNSITVNDEMFKYLENLNK